MTDKLRIGGYVKDGYWYDKNDLPHFIQNLSDKYLENIGRFLEEKIDFAKDNFTEEQLKTKRQFMIDLKSLIEIVCEQEHRKSVLETTAGKLLYK